MDELTRQQTLESWRTMRDTWPTSPYEIALQVLDARPELLPHWVRPRIKKEESK